MKHAFLATAIATGVMLMGAMPTAHAEENELRQVRLCDLSACYYAWNVVDSDNDGVSNADEVVAGTDPRDPASRPPLPLIVDMIGAQLLPTFEFGVGKMVVRPAELHAALEEHGGTMPESPLAAFPLGERKDATTRLGLDPRQMAEFGISIESDGFSLVRGFNTETNVPERRVGGVAISHISAGDDGGTAGPEEPKVVYSEKFENGDLFIKLDNKDEVLIHKDGSYERTGADGMPKKTSGYVNPDADTGDGKPTDEQIKAWERVRGATMRTVAGWSPIEVDPKEIEDRKGTIILIDPNYMDYEGVVSGPPQVDRAQPETRPDLPNPMDNVDACWPKCGP